MMWSGGMPLSLPTIACVRVHACVCVCECIYTYTYLCTSYCPIEDIYSTFSHSARMLASNVCMQLERERERERDFISQTLSLSLPISLLLSRSLALTHFRSLTFALLLLMSSQPGRRRWKLSTRAARASERVMTTTTARMLRACRHSRGNRFLIYSHGTLKAGSM